ncbi:undecaprenyl-diphosphate phosphatase [Alkalihalophilus marmarensis]|uniref:undecaprenyl-diphosphate phosphatase n=1 Tax=Alkalihalophilus marmarensis TaxID=521377 RepID=UPI002DB648FB|nr:undecaprenyl-diphosphate phosphatase [Alkalihalophilus marmarensis]MEC2070516.1 undecaprenyl-diphosphate phosphatase [Alkalihalophilus marmarensis]
MSWIEALFIGFIQGISEFLPISSSAHLLIVEKLLKINMSDSPLTFEVFLHLASLLAVLLYFRKDVLKLLQGSYQYLFKKDQRSEGDFRFTALMAASTLITMIVGKLMEGWFGDSITNTATIGAALIITGIFLILIEHGVNEGLRGPKEITWGHAVLIGLGQALAVIPGISRAGSTLVVALWCGLNKETALRYSFLLSIPIICGITLLKLPEIIGQFTDGVGLELWLAFISSFLFAIISIKWLIAMVQKAKLSYFAVYCISLGLITWIFLT